jgi:hypothetical protein
MPGYLSTRNNRQAYLTLGVDGKCSDYNTHPPCSMVNNFWIDSLHSSGDCKLRLRSKSAMCPIHAIGVLASLKPTMN